MPERELVTVTIKCEDCKSVIMDDLVVDNRLLPFLQIKKEFCEGCKKSRLEYIQLVKDVVREKFGTDVDIQLDDPDPWWYVVG